MTAAVVSLFLLATPASAEEFEVPSPPGQVYVMAVNARQQLAVDLKAFRRLFEMVKAIRGRPTAFDGGTRKATAMPDVILFNEMRPANLDIVRRLLDQRSRFDYEIVSLEGVEEHMLYNSTTLTMQGVAQRVVDPCRSTDENPWEYLVARFTENASGAPVTAAAIRFKAKYGQDTPDCREQNVQAVKTALIADVGAIILGGDFNKRPVEVEAACDPNELSPSLPWYSMLTEPQDVSRPYVDAVREFHRARNETMEDEWTFERNRQSNLCTGARSYKRSRLDYLFSAGATVAEAHTDHHGWAVEAQPGAVPLGKERFSDHRWVRGRFILSGPPRPQPPTTELGARGAVHLTWAPIDGATGYVVYRGIGRDPYAVAGRTGPELTTFTDFGRHNITYRYSVAAIGADTGQGRESIGITAVPDAQGPQVIGTDPNRGATDVPVRSTIFVRFDEGVDPASVDDSRIELYKGDRRVQGRVRQESARRLSFNPFDPMKKGHRYRVIVRPLSDRLGNRGTRYGFYFSTPEPPPKKKKDRRRR